MEEEVALPAFLAHNSMLAPWGEEVKKASDIPLYVIVRSWLVQNIPDITTCFDIRRCNRAIQ
jgi:hypothetical protein